LDATLGAEFGLGDALGFGVVPMGDELLAAEGFIGFEA
jgi:hypothetical protein